MIEPGLTLLAPNIPANMCCSGSAVAVVLKALAAFDLGLTCVDCFCFACLLTVAVQAHNGTGVSLACFAGQTQFTVYPKPSGNTDSERDTESDNIFVTSFCPATNVKV
jgi:hypothetical protein